MLLGISICRNHAALDASSRSSKSISRLTNEANQETAVLANIARSVSRGRKPITHRGSAPGVNVGLAQKTSELVSLRTIAQIRESVSTASNEDSAVLVKNGLKKRISRQTRGRQQFKVQCWRGDP